METITVITSGQNIQVVSINSAAQGPAGVSPTIANYGDNRILTSTGTSTGINGESNLTFDGSGLTVTGDVSANFYFGAFDGPIVLDCKNNTASTINKGVPVYISGHFANGKIYAAPADASNSAKMPAIGLLGETLTSGQEGHVYILGSLSNINTTAYNDPADIGKVLYVASGGGLTLTRPTGENVLIQNIARIARIHNNGRLIILGAGRTNDVPNSISAYKLDIDNIRIDGNTISSTNTNGNLIIQTTGTGAIQRDSGGNSRGQYAVDLQNARNSGTQVAAANYSNILGGSGNQIVSDSIYSIINGGQINTISANGGYNCIGGGYANIISNYNGGDSNVICGGYGNVIAGEYYGGAAIGGGESNIIQTSADDQRVPTYATIPGGFEAKTTRWGELSHAAGKFTNAGDAQHTILIARKLTTDNTANVILLLDNGISSSYKLELPNKTTWTFEIKLSAYNDTDSAGAGWIFKGAIRSDGSGNTAILGTVTEESWKDTSMSSTSANVVANDTTNSLDIRVTGLSGKNIRWVAVIDISQVCYGTP